MTSDKAKKTVEGAIDLAREIFTKFGYRSENPTAYVMGCIYAGTISGLACGFTEEQMKELLEAAFKDCGPAIDKATESFNNKKKESN